MSSSSRTGLLLLLSLAAGPAFAQTAPPAPSTQAPPTRADVRRGEYGRYRANNDLLFYDLTVRVDPAQKTISGVNTIRFRMLRDDQRIQLELHPALRIDSIRLGSQTLTSTREGSTVYIDFPETLRSGRTYEIAFSYSGAPLEQGRFGGMAFRTDPQGRPWVTTACEDDGSSTWWPSKDQWRDEPEGMRIHVAVPDGLMDVSNGRFMGMTPLGDGYTRWDWEVHYPINSYDVALNIGAYVHFSDRLGDLPLDFYTLPEDRERGMQQFAQAKPMLEIFGKDFGPYPFAKDGYKLIQVPYAGMEHQSAVAYGNGFENGYGKRDFTGVGISPRFDFIIVHESAHEWFGNAITAADVSDMWIHEGFATYLEDLYVEARWGKADAIRYVNGEKPKVKNQDPVITQRGIHRQPTEDMYFKGALFLNTLRSVVDDDARWMAVLKAFFQQFEYKTIMTEDVVAFFNAQLGRDLTPMFNQYLRRAAIPTLQLAFEPDGTLAYRWKADEPGFAMPVRAGAPGALQLLHPTTEWQLMQAPASKDQFDVATDLYYVNVEKDEVR
jgi:aminopeptidase N